MARWPQDDVDRACAVWAHQWIKAFGRPPRTASEAIGPLGCTLGRVIERHDGAASSTERDRHWPEVFWGDGLVVAITLLAMSELPRRIIGEHYLVRWYTEAGIRRQRPVKQRVIAERLGMSLPRYYFARDTAKACLRVGLCLDSSGVALAPLKTVQSEHVA
jgi:hypothetical protein